MCVFASDIMICPELARSQMTKAQNINWPGQACGRMTGVSILSLYSKFNNNSNNDSHTLIYICMHVYELMQVIEVICQVGHGR